MIWLPRGLLAASFFGLLSACAATPDVPSEAPATGEPASEAAPSEGPIGTGLFEAPGLEEPPPMEINGVAGQPVTWCWGGACVDGFAHDPSILPSVGAPDSVKLPEGTRIESVTAFGAGAPGQAPQIVVPSTGTTIGELPEGTLMFSASLRFATSEDATYYWALDTADQ